MNYEKALKLRQAKTGGWLLKSEKYTEWKKNAALPLWLYGIPGCGKTILCSAILHDVLEDCRDGVGRVACFFFDFNDKQKQDPGRMLRSLVWQLSWQSDSIPTRLDSLFSLCQSGQQQPSPNALQKALQSRIEELPQVYVVLDALDECAERTELMNMLETMAGWKLQNLHLLLTSRKEPDIESTLEEIVDDQRRICLESALVDKDIQRYVQHRIATDKTLQRWRKDDIRQEIETILSDNANGMYAFHSSFIQYNAKADDRFRWAACQLDGLSKCLNRKTLRTALATLPPTLDQTYERILSTLSEAHSEYALRILRWLTFSARPLSVNEIAEAVAIDTERDPAFDRDDVLEDPLDALQICSSLVTITINYNEHDEPQEIVVLAHYSVREYLVSDRIWEGKAAKYGMRDDVCHDAIARSCLSYLLPLEQAELPPDFLQEFRFAEYSAQCWIDHVRKTSEQSEEMDQLVVRLFLKNNSYINLRRLCDRNNHPANSDFRYGQEKLTDPLHYAAGLGLERVVKLLLDAGADVNAHSELWGSALQIASHHGHELTVKLLLEAGAEVNAQCSRFEGTALWEASCCGHEPLVKLLLNVGADVNAQSRGQLDALGAASYKDHKQIVKLLLDAGANVDAHGSIYNASALWAASNWGHEQIVELLLKAGADVNARCRDHKTALEAASFEGHERIVKLLLDSGADVDLQGTLSAASYRGHERIIKLLLDAGADAHDGDALAVASHSGHEQIVKLLLDIGVDVNAQKKHEDSALQAASRRGHKQIVELLLNAGADAHDKDALQAASRYGYEPIVKLLLNAGADVNAEDGKALQLASNYGHKQIVKLLLDAGASDDRLLDDTTSNIISSSSSQSSED